jgi:hypothetical protein
VKTVYGGLDEAVLLGVLRSADLLIYGIGAVVGESESVIATDRFAVDSEPFVA